MIDKKLPTRVDQEEQAFRRLIQVQQAQGFWELTAWLAKQVGISLNRLKKIARQLKAPRRESEQLLATLLARYLLHTRFQKLEAEWALVAAKAERWLKAHNLTPPPPGPEVLPWLLRALTDFFSQAAPETHREGDSH